MDSCEKVYPFLLSVRRVVAWPGINRGCTKKCHPAIGAFPENAFRPFSAV